MKKTDIIKKVCRCFSGVILTAAALGLMSAVVSAEEIDLTKRGSITIKFVNHETGEAITGSEFTLYQVALLSEVDNNLVYTYSGDFYYCTVDLTNSLSLSRSLAEELEEYEEEINAEGITKAIGSDGTAEFDNLPLGLYLVNETKASPYYYSSGPFIVAIPIYQDDMWVYDVTAMPKPQSLSEDNTETTTEAGDSGGGDGTTETTTEGTEETTSDSTGGSGGDKTEHEDDDDDDDGGGTDKPSGGGGGGGTSYIIGEPDPEVSHVPSSTGGSDYSNSPDNASDEAEDDDMAEDTEEEDDAGDSPGVDPEEDREELDPEDGPAEKLPQTGQHNLPVPVLALCGLSMFSAGWKLYFTDGSEK